MGHDGLRLAAGCNVQSSGQLDAGHSQPDDRKSCFGAHRPSVRLGCLHKARKFVVTGTAAIAIVLFLTMQHVACEEIARCNCSASVFVALADRALPAQVGLNTRVNRSILARAVVVTFRQQNCADRQASPKWQARFGEGEKPRACRVTRARGENNEIHLVRHGWCDASFDHPRS
jgi:hypothetical protein